jgi:cell division protein FtsB
MSLQSNLSKNFGGLRDAVGRAGLSSVEIVFLSAAILFVGIVAFFYLTKVQPLNSRIAAQDQQIQNLRAEIQKLNTDEKKRVDQSNNAGKILDSLKQFESYLKPDERGMTQIINEIDDLGRTHKIVVGDASYRVEEADESQLDENGNPRPQAANKDKKPKIYPNLGIDTTVIGDYANLRHFLSDLERSKQFLIVNALAFQGGDEKVVRQLAKGGKQIQLSGPESIPVSLRIELDTYFKPPTNGIGEPSDAGEKGKAGGADTTPPAKAGAKNGAAAGEKPGAAASEAKKAQALN